MKKLLLILLCLPFIGFGQNWEPTYIGCSQNEIKQLIDYLNTVDREALEKIAKRKKEGKKIKKKRQKILDKINNLDPN